jgi:hypothetical protein
MTNAEIVVKLRAVCSQYEAGAICADQLQRKVMLLIAMLVSEE